jgi:hypothetical protein
MLFENMIETEAAVKCSGFSVYSDLYTALGEGSLPGVSHDLLLAPAFIK